MFWGVCGFQNVEVWVLGSGFPGRVSRGARGLGCGLLQ